MIWVAQPSISCTLFIITNPWDMNSNLMSLSANLMQFFSHFTRKIFCKKTCREYFLSNFSGDQYRNTAESYVKNLCRWFKWKCTPGLNQPYRTCRLGFKILWELLGSLLNVNSREAHSDLSKGLKRGFKLRSHTLPQRQGFGQNFYLIKSCQIL